MIDGQGMYVTAELDGEQVTMTEGEFDEHPDTRSLTEVDDELVCYFDCCAWCANYDGNTECECRTGGCVCF